jgi:hypothetical protein
MVTGAFAEPSAMSGSDTGFATMAARALSASAVQDNEKVPNAASAATLSAANSARGTDGNGNPFGSGPARRTLAACSAGAEAGD